MPTVTRYSISTILI